MTMNWFGNSGRVISVKKGDTPAKSYVDFSIAVEEYTGKDSSGRRSTRQLVELPYVRPAGG